MAKQQKLMEAFDAFINNDLKTAKKCYREFFIESAREINATLEEEFGGDMEDELYDEVGVDLDDDEGVEDFEEFEDFEDFEDEEEGHEDHDEEDEFDDEEEFDDEDEEEHHAPTEEEWEDFEDAFEELEALFNDARDGEADDLVEESFDYTKVQVPSNAESAVDAKSPVAPEQKVGPTGAKASTMFSKDGHVSGSNTKLETPDADKPHVEDHNNVMKNGQHAYKPEAMPKMKEPSGINTHSNLKPYKK